MSWRTTDRMQQRRAMIDDFLSGAYSKVELATRYDRSRPTIDHWITRFTADGAPGLVDRSRRPHQCPHRTDERCQQVILSTRATHPQWGARTIRDRLRRTHPELLLPA